MPPCTCLTAASGYCGGIKKKTTTQNSRKTETKKTPVTKKACLVCGLSLRPSPGLWYLGPTLKAMEAVGSLIIDTAGQAGNSCAQGQAAPNLHSAKSPSKPTLPPLPPLSLVTLAPLICNSTRSAAAPGKRSRAVNRVGVSQAEE